ncbi:envelope glycoprotein [Simian immunodeficiency virus]|uniref:Envelope glycoprotein gp160 n=1 Tax=Simian immunodeficiency virus TaxID=11723 RepID=D5G2S1_SIV|nr:envelope glycoprotein [Simian immunodeficiency virus]
MLAFILAIIVIILGQKTEQVSQQQQYVTVFYGVPVWKNASVGLFCTANGSESGWAVTACLPHSVIREQVHMPNVSQYFDAFKNPIEDQLWEDMTGLYKQTYRPCVKLTPYCVKMRCKTETTLTSNLTTPKTTTDWSGENNTMSQYWNCSFNVSGPYRDKKEEGHAMWLTDDLEWANGNETGDTRGAYMRYCNRSVITQACDKSHFKPFKIRYCAPAGYGLMRCDDKNFNGTGLCTNVSAVACTNLIHTMASTWLQFNGSDEERAEEIHVIRKGLENKTITIRIPPEYNLRLDCVRPGNKTYRATHMATGLSFYTTFVERLRIKRAHCRMRGNWSGAVSDIKQVLKGIYNVTNITMHYPGGDREVQRVWFQCHGEYFYCNVSKAYQLFTNDTITWSNNTLMPCKINQLVNTWYKIGQHIYLPPREGELRCDSHVSAIIFDVAHYGHMLNLTPSSDIKAVWRADLYKYKIIEVQPIGFAPTAVRRYEGPESVRQKRAVGMALGLVAFLSTAGAAMGAASTALTVQSRSLLSGIVQQQQELLKAVEAHGHLLTLTAWGVKNLNTRLTALEKYLKDQSKLNEWGCAFKQICHTTVPWNGSIGQPDWNNMTWQEWEQKVANYTDIWEEALQKAQEKQEQNVHALQSLQDWDSLWNWFDLSRWFWWIRIVVYVIAGLVLLRIIMFVVNIISKLCRGYSPLQTPFQKEDLELPGEGEGGVGGSTRRRWTPSPQGFLSLIWGDLQQLLSWLYQTFRNFIWLLTRGAEILQEQIYRLSFAIWTLLQRLGEQLRVLWGYLQYGWKEFKDTIVWAGGELGQTFQRWAEVALQVLGRGIREILAIPARIRQGAELFLN